MAAAATSTTSAYRCGICLMHGETEDNELIIMFPSQESGLAHEQCFQKIEASWQAFSEGLKKAFGAGGDYSLEHRRAITWLYKTQLVPLKKSLLQAFDDKNIGETGVSKLFQLALENSKSSKTSKL